MALGRKLFEESGKVTGFKLIKVHPVEGVTTEVSFKSDVKGLEKFPTGKNLGSGTITKYPHGIIDATWQGSLMTETSEEFMWWDMKKAEFLMMGKSGD